MYNKYEKKDKCCKEFILRLCLEEAEKKPECDESWGGGPGGGSGGNECGCR